MLVLDAQAQGLGALGHACQLRPRPNNCKSRAIKPGAVLTAINGGASRAFLGDWANHVEDEEFDATDAILAMPLEKLHALVNSDTSTDDIGRAHVSWDGPFEVHIVDEICEFFGVEAVSDITQANLDHVRTRHVPAVKLQKTVLLTIRVSVDTTEGTDLADFVSEMDYSVKSKLMGTKVRSTEVEDFCVVA